MEEGEKAMNREGYKDPTAEEAMRNIMSKPADLEDLIWVIRKTAGMMGYDITNRMHFKDRRTGREYK